MGVFVNLRRIKLHVSVRVEDLNGKAAASGHDVQVELAVELVSAEQVLMVFMFINLIQI